ncbi:hypothetical protein ABFA07_023062 [Porites harrisoni]
MTETQQSFERVKRCIEVSPSAPRTLKSSKVNKPLRSSRCGLNFGPQGDKDDRCDSLETSDGKGSTSESQV